MPLVLATLDELVEKTRTVSKNTLFRRNIWTVMLKTLVLGPFVMGKGNPSRESLILIRPCPLPRLSRPCQATTNY